MLAATPQLYKMVAPGRIVSICIILRMIFGVGCNTVIKIKQGELSLETVNKIRNIENSLEQIGKIVESRDDRIKGLNIEIRGFKNELHKKSENFALKVQEHQDCKTQNEMLGFLQI